MQGIGDNYRDAIRGGAILLLVTCGLVVGGAYWLGRTHGLESPRRPHVWTTREVASLCQGADGLWRETDGPCPPDPCTVTTTRPSAYPEVSP